MSSFAIPTFNFGGLASGLDTNSIIDQLMSIEQQPRSGSSRSRSSSRRGSSVLKDVQTRMRNLSLQVASLRDPGTWNDVQTVDSTDTTKVTATRTGGAAAGGYSIQIVGLARAAQMTQGGVRDGGAVGRRHVPHRRRQHNAVDVAIEAGDSLQTIADKINRRRPARRSTRR